MLFLPIQVYMYMLRLYGYRLQCFPRHSYMSYHSYLQTYCWCMLKKNKMAILTVFAKNKSSFETLTGVFLYLLVLFTEKEKGISEILFFLIFVKHLDEEHYHNVTAVMGIIVISNTQRSYCTIIYI